jgi:hypothetical protein
MKYIKKFNEQERSIEDWCKEFKIEEYIINKDNSVDVLRSLCLNDIDLVKIPIQFGVVFGSFGISLNLLSSLNGCPRSVINGFMCDNNQLVTLEGSPRVVGGKYSCTINKLISLKGSPKEVRSFYCKGNLLTSLEGGPNEISFQFDCSDNQLTSLIGGPIKVDDEFNCRSNKLTSLEGCPKKLKLNNIHCQDNPIYEIYKLFASYKDYQESINDYKYLRGTNIILRRFERACEDAEIDIPDSIPGYKYIDL